MPIVILYDDTCLRKLVEVQGVRSIDVTSNHGVVRAIRAKGLHLPIVLLKDRRVDNYFAGVKAQEKLLDKYVMSLIQ